MGYEGMIGNNTLYINQATAIEAMECWLATQMVTPPKVRAVKSVKRDMYDSGFEIEITADDEQGQQP